MTVQDIPLSDFVGKECWRTLAGKGTGSMFTLDLGEKIQRLRPLPSKHLDETIRNFEGEYSLYVTFGDWRVEGPEGVICTSRSSNEKDGEMVTGLKRLEGEKIVEASMTGASRDLLLAFSSGLVLRVFVNAVDDEEDDYSLFFPQGVWTVGAKGRLRGEK
ncbi:hypothetical protein KBB96_08890 [Luteolibacter ambystomatis]|uniref:Uncharacterized protein n=1 Tax=Luteolibacter ambystomatis TaxID=2824561 RepID=A0A975J2S3_9BACT|nr:hypothetical protein [Luteolibacter ambystomatis]QUE52993.1 hypothetical protein KBB96_08890 [Luteolibacter ambystomatis]